MNRSRKLWAVGALLLVLLTCLTACRTAPVASPLHRFEFSSPHMGTVFSIKVYSPDKASAQAAAKAAFERVAELEQVMSDYRADSELMRLCEQPFGTPVPVSTDLFRILEIAQM